MAAPAVGGLQYDAQGRPYYVLANGERSYVSPAAMGGQAPADTTGILHKRPQWNQQTGQWETPFDWGNLLNIGTAAALTGGAANALMSGGGPTMASTAANTAANLPAGAVTGAGAAAGGAGAVAGGAGAASSLPSWVKPAVAFGGPLAMRAMRSGPGDGSGSNGPGGSSGDVSGQLQQLIQLLIDRANRTTPVHEAAMRMATRMSPSMESSPRMDDAITASQSPRRTTETDPQVLSAIQKLMMGGG